MGQRMKLENQAVIEAINSGSEKILLLLYEDYRDDFIKWSAFHYGISSDEAKDYFQEVVIAFYHNVRTGATESIETSIKTYLFSIGKNYILNGMRHRSYEEKIIAGTVAKDHNPIEDEHEREHLLQTVRRLYKIIGTPCREILEMFYVKNFDMESIASRMGYKNANVAKKKKYECIKEIEEKIKLNSLN
jgi:RNA polymerase sigma-70 factor (ECF subfamily)